MKHEKIAEFRSKRLVYNHMKYTEIEPYFIPPHYHDVFEILYIKNGDLTYHVEGKKYRVKKNSLIITSPLSNHNIDINTLDIYERYDFLVENKVIKESILQRLPAEMNVINLNEYPQIAEIFTKIDFYVNYFEGDELKKVLSNLVEEVFYNIIIIAENFSQNQTNGSYTANAVIAAAIEYIDQNLSSNFSIEDLCRELFISKSYLHGLFMEHLQTTPKKHITSKRLLFAQRKLRQYAKPTDIYADCGFADYSSFYRAYKKYFGYPPSEELEHKIYRVIEF